MVEKDQWLQIANSAWIASYMWEKYSHRTNGNEVILRRDVEIEYQYKIKCNRCYRQTQTEWFLFVATGTIIVWYERIV